MVSPTKSPIRSIAAHIEVSGVKTGSTRRASVATPSPAGGPPPLPRLLARQYLGELHPAETDPVRVHHVALVAARGKKAQPRLRERQVRRERDEVPADVGLDRAALEDHLVAAGGEIEPAQVKLHIEQGTAEDAVRDQVREDHADHRRGREVVVPGELEHDEDRGQGRADDRARYRHHPADRVDRDIRTELAHQQLDPIAGERPEQDADEEGGAQHPARESEADAKRRREQLGHEEERELARGECVLDDREAKRFLADPEDVGHPDRGDPEDGAGEHRLHPVGDGHAAGDAARVKDRPHVENGDEGAADPDEDETEELRGGDPAHVFHPEERRPLEDDVRDDVTDGRGDRDGGERAQGVVPEDDLVREDDPREGRIERGRDRGRDAAPPPTRSRSARCAG